MAKPKGWFKTADRDGDRTLEEQLVGLESLIGTVYGKTVLDVGSAEGLMDVKLAENGAKVHGIEIVPGHVEYAKRHAKHGVTYEVADATTYMPAANKYDYVLLLAILHKLKDPTAVAVKFARVARVGCVVRLPATGAVIRDSRSSGKPHDINAAMKVSGLELVLETRGVFDEWIGYYERPKAKESEDERLARVKQHDPWNPSGKAPNAVPAFEKTAPLEHQSVSEHVDLEVRAFTDPDAAADLAGLPRPDNTTGEATTDQTAEKHEMAPPPNSVHPSGDPAVQLPIEKIEPLPLEGHEGARRRRRSAPKDTAGE